MPMVRRKWHSCLPIQNSAKKEHFVIDDLDMTTPAYVHNIIQHMIDQKSKKSTEDHELLGQTGIPEKSMLMYSFNQSSDLDMTIVVVSILFIILLAIVNLILFAMRR